MAFADTFAKELGDRTSSTVDAGEFPDSDTVNTDLDALQSFLDGLDDTSRGTLDIITGDGIDLAQATDDDGNPGVPGGSPLTVASAVAEPLGDLLVQAQTAFQVAIEDTSSMTGQGQVATTAGRTTNTTGNTTGTTTNSEGTGNV